MKGSWVATALVWALVCAWLELPRELAATGVVFATVLGAVAHRRGAARGRRVERRDGTLLADGDGAWMYADDDLP